MTTAIIIGVAAVAVLAAAALATGLRLRKKRKKAAPSYERYGLPNPKYDRFR